MPRTLAIAAGTLAIALAASGCGSSSHPQTTASTVAQPPPVTATTSATLPPPCSQRARAAIPGHVRRAQPFDAPSGSAGCRLEGSRLTAIVLIDSAPQPYVRMERKVVEYGQNVEWTTVPGRAFPRSIKHLGLDADWFPLESRLLTTDGVRLTEVKLHAPAMESRAREELAIRLSRAYLGPLHKPPGY